jgi:NAD(P)-dependent dehydrogenase (short-subunit alcohol dehydrogenase family)
VDLNREFEGKVAIVTGASRGIGLAAARLIAERGASVVLVARNPEGLAEAIGERSLWHGAPVASFAGDVAVAGTADAAIACCLKHFGKLDVLLNVAGAFPTALLEATSDRMYEETIAANLTGTFAMCRAALPLMMQQGSGVIVNVSSTAARMPTPGLSVYSASKAGIEAFSRSIASEAAPRVRVNVVSAGPTLTETVETLMASDDTGAVDAVTKAIPLGRLGQTREIAEALLFLASDRASFITGQVLHANGGGIMA